MSKLVKILDRKPMEIYVGRKTRGPILGIRLDESVIGRLLRSTDAPRDIYAMNPAGKSVRLTLENYKLTEEELFAETKEIKKENSLADAVQNALNRSAENSSKFVTATEDKSESEKEQDIVIDETLTLKDEKKDDENEKVANMTSGFIHVVDENNGKSISETAVNIGSETTVVSTNENVKQNYNKPSYNKNNKNNNKK